jgi:hypothetical protein
MSKARNISDLLGSDGDIKATYLDNVSGGSSSVPFYKADGSQDNITLISGELPFYKADGTQDNIGVI